MWYFYTIEFYSATKKNDILSFAGKWLKLEDIILSEISNSKGHMWNIDLIKMQKYYETVVTLRGGHIQEG
jgi:hypothetical protein